MTLQSACKTIRGMVKSTAASGKSRSARGLRAWFGSEAHMKSRSFRLLSLSLVALFSPISHSWAQLTAFNIWQLQYFGCRNCPQAAPDADPWGKGISNSNQFLLGLDPTNSTSVFRILSVVPATNTGNAPNNASSFGLGPAQPSADFVVTYYTTGGNPYTPPPPRTNVLEYSNGTPSGGYTNDFVSTGVTNIIVGPGDVITNMVDVGGATNSPARFYRVRTLL